MPTNLGNHLCFTRLELENVKSFGEPQHLNLSMDGARPLRWTLLPGENNVGKTTLLDCPTRIRPAAGNRYEGDPTGERGFLPELAAK